MKNIAVLVFTTFLSCAAFGQNRPGPIASPEILPDQRVTFRLRAPQAKAVELRGQWTKEGQPLARGENDTWSTTVGPVPAGVWEYSFTVDGLLILDPTNPELKPQREPGKSILQIPGNPPNPWDWQDVPHGTVHQHGYQSKALGRPRELWVYTPAGYELDTAKKYPLLVLQHGSGDNQQTWVRHGKAHWILDNLIAKQAAVPMVVVMLDGHPLGKTPNDGPPQKRGDAMDAFKRELFEDGLPLVEYLYRVEKDAAHRAIAGLSMGGGQSLSVGLGNLDRFAWIGAFSSAPANEQYIADALANPEKTNQALRLLWIAVGKDDFLRTRAEQFAGVLESKGIHREWKITEGDHSWPVWRGYLAEFAPLLFKENEPLTR